jgi:7-cyano-7-deazaguanine synthase in queuosine biosynthesis
MSFIIPVRKPGFWSQPKVRDALVETLDFLSEDSYNFCFIKLQKSPSVDDYFEFSDEDVAFDAEEVLLFSGGLDSLGGVVKEVFLDRKQVALVSHRSAPKIAPKQKDLHTDVCNRCADNPKPKHIPVWIQKHGWEAMDNSQRTRSFLYASLAAVVAHMFGRDRIRFYENGVTSLNLSIAEQIIGARATRTTHPRSIAGFHKQLSLLSDGSFQVETPFMWKTKTDVLELIKDAGLADLMKYAVSCSHVWAMTKLHTHCGCCSQCIDRHLAVFASDCVEHDPDEMYKTDVFAGQRSEKKQDNVLAESYVRSMRECADLTEVQFFSRYGELSRAISYISGTSDDVAEKVFQLYVRNGQQVRKAIANALRHYADNLARKKPPDRSLFRQLFGTQLPLPKRRKSKKTTKRTRPKQPRSATKLTPWNKSDTACFIHREGVIKFYYKEKMKTIPFRPGTQAPRVLTAFMTGTHTGKEIKNITNSKMPPSQVIRNVNRTICAQLRKIGFEDVSDIAFIHFDENFNTYTLIPRIVDIDDFDRAHFFEK